MDRKTARGPIRTSGERHPDRTQSDDNALVRAARKGDLAAFEELVRRYREPMIRLAYRFVRNIEDARDLSQDGFVRAYTSLDRYRAGTRFDRWLGQIVANVCRDFLRKRRRTPSEGLDQQADALEDPRAGPDRIAEMDDLQGRFERELALLPYSWRIVFALREQEGMKHEEIAELLGENVGTIRWRMYKARERLRERLADLLID